MLHIDKQTFRQMIEYCLEQRPHEACGFLTGRASGAPDIVRIDRFIPVSNRSPRPDRHFDMDPREVIRALYGIEAEGAELLGIVHSHPQAPPLPSEEDLQTPWHRAASHWIISLHGAPEARAYKYSRQDDGSVKWSKLAIAVND